MIPDNELRKGNLIMFEPSGKKKVVKNRPVKVKELHEKSIITLDGGLELELFYESASVQPIPLTPEIFLRNGFSQSFTSDPQEPNASQVFEIDYLSIHQHNENENRFYWYYGEIEVEIKSIHQLQNLHFTLFQAELSITL